MRRTFLIAWVGLFGAGCGGVVAEPASADSRTEPADGASEAVADGAAVADSGGWDGNTEDLPAPFMCATGTWPRQRARSRAPHTTTLLPDGRLLELRFDAAPAKAFAIDPKSLKEALLGSLLASYDRPTSALLPDGRVLVIGDTASSVTIFNPTLGSTVAAASMSEGHADGAVVLMPNGKVLVVGGFTDSTAPVAPAVIYDPIANRWQATALPAIAKSVTEATATLLADGNVLVTSAIRGAVGDLTQSTFVYSPTSDTWLRVGEMKQRRYHYTVTLLTDGRVLAAGGGSGAEDAISTAEVYDPAARSWTMTSPMARGRTGHTATRLDCGGVLVVGGSESGAGPPTAEIYDPSSRTWHPATRPFTRHFDHTATRVADGSVVVIGAETDTAGIEVFKD